MNLKTGISKEVVFGGCLLLLVLEQAEGGLIPINGSEIFTDSHGGTWDGNNLTLMIEPSILHNPFVQVGEDFPMRKVPIDQLDSTGNRLIPENLVGISFDLPEIPDTTLFTWQFHVAAYQGDSSAANGVIVVGTETGELATRSGLEPFMPLESSGRIELSFDHEFFQSADRFFFQFKVSGATPRAVAPRSLPGYDGHHARHPKESRRPPDHRRGPGRRARGRGRSVIPMPRHAVSRSRYRSR